MFGKYLSALRRESKQTQQQLADALGVDRVSVSHWENDKNLPDPKKMPEIAARLGVGVGELMSRAYPESGVAYKQSDASIALNKSHDDNSSMTTDRLLEMLAQRLAKEPTGQAQDAIAVLQGEVSKARRTAGRTEDPNPQYSPNRRRSN